MSNILTDSLNENLMKVFDMQENNVADVTVVDGEILETDTQANLPVEQKASEIDQNLEDDIEKTRNNVSILMKSGDKALQSALALAVSAESPRAIEAFSNLLKTLSDVNASLLDAHVKVETVKQKRRGKGEATEAPQTQNNLQQNITVFNGTTEEALALLRSKKT